MSVPEYMIPSLPWNFYTVFIKKVFFVLGVVAKPVFEFIFSAVRLSHFIPLNLFTSRLLALSIAIISYFILQELSFIFKDIFKHCMVPAYSGTEFTRHLHCSLFEGSLKCTSLGRCIRIRYIHLGIQVRHLGALPFRRSRPVIYIWGTAPLHIRFLS